MKDVLADIQSGAFVNRWVAVQEAGGAEFQELRARDRDHQIEKVGAELRAQMQFLNPVVVYAGEAQAAASAGGAATPSAARRDWPEWACDSAATASGSAMAGNARSP